jgi:chemotaxis protein methyltransferase CheR
VKTAVWTDVDRSAAPSDLSAASFARFAGFITAELGIRMPESKATLIQSRLLRRVRDLHLNSVDEYAEYFFAAADEGEREQLINAITTNKTDFFRESEHFDLLADTVLPGILRGFDRGRVQVWSAGCSSGEEPYTLAMLLDQFVLAQRGWDYAVLATDISTKVLDRARDGIYEEAQVEPVPLGMRRKYLLRSRSASGTVVRVVPSLRQRVSFHQLNFMDSEYAVEDTFHAIFFRNVMIYFDRKTQEAVVRKLCRHLAPGGYFFTGHSESLTGMDLPLRPVRTSVYRKPE